MRIKLYPAWLIDPLSESKTPSDKRQAQLLAVISLVFGLLNIIGVMFTVPATGWTAENVNLLILSAFTFAAYALSRTKYFGYGSILFIWTWAIGAYVTAAFSSNNPAGALTSMLSMVFIISTALLSIKATALLVVANFIAFFFLGTIVPSLTATDASSTAGTAGTIAVLVLILAWFRNFTEQLQLNEISMANAQLKSSNQQLEEHRHLLEERVQERTGELEAASAQNQRRIRQFEAIVRVSQTIMSTKNLKEALPLITRAISEQMGFYHVGVFLNDVNNQYAVLSAANSEGGQVMLARGHQLKIGEQGIVGYVAFARKPRIALDVGADATFFNNPDLPLTRSEMALPLKVSDSMIGVLDIQSEHPNAFTSEDVDILSTLADQVSLAIENARLFDQTRKSLGEAESISRQYLRQAWGNVSQGQKLIGYRYTTSGVYPLESTENTTINPNGGDTERHQVTVPIILRGEQIGALKIQTPRAESIKQDQIDLIKAVAERVALAAENARLFEETTQRAERERLVSDITNKIRSVNDPGQMIQTALAELQQALNATRVEIVPSAPAKKTDQ